MFLSYHRLGWLHAPGVYDAAQVADLRAHLAETAHAGPAWHGTWRTEFPETSHADTLRQQHYTPERDPTIRAIVDHPPLLALVGELLETSAPRLHHVAAIIKPAETGQAFPWHQDAIYYPHADGRYVVVMLYLDDVTPENGSLRVVSGSHLDGPLVHLDPGRKRYLPRDQYEALGTVIPAQAGDVVCANYYLVHGSLPNRSGAVRRALRMGFRHPDNQKAAPLTEGPMRDAPSEWGPAIADYRDRMRL